MTDTTHDDLLDMVRDWQIENATRDDSDPVKATANIVLGDLQAAAEALRDAKRKSATPNPSRIDRMSDSERQ
jgi:hypothetical protein